MSEKVYNSILLIIALCLFSFAGWAIYKQSTLGDNEDDFDIICIQGHKYYKADFLTKGFLGINLNDNGKPINCKVQ